MDDLERLQEISGIQLNEGMAEEQLLVLHVALSIALENHKTITPQDLARLLDMCAPNVRPPGRSVTKAKRIYAHWEENAGFPMADPTGTMK